MVCINFKLETIGFELLRRHKMEEVNQLHYLINLQMNTFLLNTGDKFNIEEKATKETDKSTKWDYEFKKNQVVVTAMVIGSETISEGRFLRRD